MRARMFVGAALVAVMLTVASGSSASFAGQSVSAGTAAGSSSDVLRIGTINYIDSLNPYNYIEAQAYNAMMMIYPQLVQYGKGMKFEGDWASSWKTSAGGKDWTFRLRPNTKWSDGEPMTASDASLDDQHDRQVREERDRAGRRGSGAREERAGGQPDHARDPLRVARRQRARPARASVHSSAARLAKAAGAGGKGLRPTTRSFISHGHRWGVHARPVREEGHDRVQAGPEIYGPPSQAAGVALTYYTNADAVIADLKANNLDWADQVPFKAVNAVKKSQNIVVTTIPSAETTNITWNSNPVKPKNRELLKPAVKKALSETFAATERCGLWCDDMEVLRLHYRYTVKHWRERFAKNRAQAAAIYDERFCRMWEFYLAAVELEFLHGSHMVFQLLLSTRRDAVPITRDFMIDAERAAWAKTAPSEPQRPFPVQ